MYPQTPAEFWVLWLTIQNPVFEWWSLLHEEHLILFNCPEWSVNSSMSFASLGDLRWPELMHYDGKYSLQSVLPNFSLVIYWPPTPLFSFCCCPNFPISSICFKKLSFGRQCKHCTSTDVFSVRARNGHTLMWFFLAPFVVWRDLHCMNTFILLLGSFCPFFFSPSFPSHDTVANLVFLWLVPSSCMTLLHKSSKSCFWRRQLTWIYLWAPLPPL